MKIKIKTSTKNWYLNDDQPEDPYLTDDVNDASEKFQDEVDNFVSYIKTYAQGKGLLYIHHKIKSKKRYIEFELKDIVIIRKRTLRKKEILFFK